MTQPVHAPDILAAVAAAKIRLVTTLERPSTSDNCATSRHALAPVCTTSIHHLAGSLPGIWYVQRDQCGVEVQSGQEPQLLAACLLSQIQGQIFYWAIFSSCEQVTPAVPQMWG